ncbi:4'-phosphopantetheinyl transferase superfamily protein [Pyxidicoccus parkwayensis]|uniref:4'-phosphopantetheinyl transferase superfamily protein n=1 Tax=Pyxidicoccus parkwayensis TaxID=2813578 RepID=A0ABX7P502_9BACT|nr:4'-phosphopantetheinyl transferase superfamily protein [Pyxidicoccus parkwaysis]QSQ25570.1 4'-phosphopantetheinyl transferase superfamily protein [Pyxidicoccus parkwaysis]
MTDSESAGSLQVEASTTVSLGMVRHGEPVPGVLACVYREASAGLDARCLALLHPNEQQRLEELRAESRRLGYFLGRHAAKLAVRTLGGVVPMRAVEIASGVFEQPIVKGALGDAPVVSLSHTRSVAVAVACEPEHILGVDVEQLDPQRTDVFESVMPPRELTMARRAPGGGVQAVNLIWAMKEALSKALRCGLTTPFEVLESESFEPHGDGGWSCLFHNFAQYQARAWVLGHHVLAVVSPKHSIVRIAPEDLERVRQVLERDASRS